MTNRYIFLLGLVVAGLGACGADEPVAENAEVPLSLPIAVAASGGNPLAEAAANDTIWGIGLSVAEAQKGTAWKGQNILGNTLMQVRENLVGMSN